jgi:hypothetical protein
MSREVRKITECPKGKGMRKAREESFLKRIKTSVWKFSIAAIYNLPFFRNCNSYPDRDRDLVRAVAFAVFTQHVALPRLCVRV